MSLLKALVMAIAAKPYQAFPLFAAGLIECGCGNEYCPTALDDDVISFQVGLTPCSEPCQNLIELGGMTPLAIGTNTSVGTGLVDATKNFVTLGVQTGVTCGYVVRNTTTATYSWVSVVVTPTTLTVNAAIFTAIGQGYEIYPFQVPNTNTTFNGTVCNLSAGPFLRQCNIGLTDGKYYVGQYDIITPAATTDQMTLGGDTHSSGAAASPFMAAGTRRYGFAPQVWSDDDWRLLLGAGATTAIDNVQVCMYSTIGIRIRDCEGNVVLDDQNNNHGWVTYQEGYLAADTDPRAQVDIDWTTTGLGTGCFQICLYDVCTNYYAAGFEPCTLESHSFNVIDDRSNPECGLKIEWTNNEDFELENGDYIDYPQYPSAQYIQRLRLNGNVRFAGYINDDHTLDGQTDGLREVVHSLLHKQYELQLPPLPESIHDALAAGLRHDVFSVNDVLYVWADGEYTPSWKKTYDMAPVVVKLIPKYSKGENVA